MAINPAWNEVVLVDRNCLRCMWVTLPIIASWSPHSDFVSTRTTVESKSERECVCVCWPAAYPLGLSSLPGVRPCFCVENEGSSPRGLGVRETLSGCQPHPKLNANPTLRFGHRARRALSLISSTLGVPDFANPNHTPLFAKEASVTERVLSPIRRSWAHLHNTDAFLILLCTCQIGCVRVGWLVGWLA